MIDGYSKPNRLEVDYRAAICGRGNRLDHSRLANKTNAGSALVVVRDLVQGLENDARVDRNYFGHRPVLGSNCGETVRIGTSSDFRPDYRSVVEFNWFDRRDGEVEIVSNKSGGNTYRGNVFFELFGALTLRHGHGNLFEDKVFLGNGLAHTRGNRAPNRNQTARNTYLDGLDGEDFFSALSVLYGIPNGPINRHDPVENAVIANKTIIEAKELWPRRIQVNALSPGLISTRLHAPARTTRCGSPSLELHPSRREGRSEDVAEASAFLTSYATGFVTGITLTVSGGLYLS